MRIIHHISPLLCSLLLLASMEVCAQKVWTLQDCISQALSHNLQAKDRNYASQALEEEKRQSVRAMLPTLQAFSSYSISYGRSVDPNTNAVVSNDFFFNNYGLDADIDLFQGFQKQHQKAASKFIHEAAIEANKQEDYLLAFRVMNAFYDVRFFEGALKNAKEQVQISENNKAFIEKQIEVGIIPGSDIHIAESILIGDELQVLRAENDLQASQLRLAQAMNLDTGTSGLSLLDEELPDAASSAYLLDSIYESASENLPIMQSQRLTVEAAKSRLKQSRGLLSPSLSAFAGYGTGYFETNVDAEERVIPFDQQIKDNASQYIGLSISIPILEGWSRRSQVNQQKIQLLREMNNMDIQRQEVEQTIQETYSAERAARAEYLMSRENVAALEISYEVAQKKYEKGLFSALELYRAKNLLAQAQNDYLQLKMRTIILSKTLDFYAGVKVFDLTTAK